MRASGPARWALLAAALGVAIAICVLLLTPGSSARRSPWLALLFNGGHALLFFLQTLPLLLAFERGARPALFASVLVFAATTEVLQTRVGRDGSVGDFVTDSAGVYAAWALVVAFAPGTERRRYHVPLAIVCAAGSAAVETFLF